MRILSWRLIVALVIGVTLVSLASSWFEVRTQKDALRSELEYKAGTLSESLAGTAELYLVNSGCSASAIVNTWLELECMARKVHRWLLLPLSIPCFLGRLDR
jgi:hypothetical protein